MPKNYCGPAVHNLRLKLVEVCTYTHGLLLTIFRPVDLVGRYTLTYTHLCTYMCTAYLHVLDNISSVSNLVVHIIHIAYKKEFILRKGII